MMGKKLKAELVCGCGKTSMVRIIKKLPARIRCPSCKRNHMVTDYMLIDDTKYRLISHFVDPPVSITFTIRSKNIPDGVSFTNT